MTDTFDRTQLDGKDREQLSEIASALGVKAISRMRKADLVEAIPQARRYLELIRVIVLGEIGWRVERTHGTCGFPVALDCKGLADTGCMRQASPRIAVARCGVLLSGGAPRRRYEPCVRRARTKIRYQ